MNRIPGGKLLAILALLTYSASPGQAGNDKNYVYLALGDSVAFGLNPTLLTSNPPPTPDDFTGYPEFIAKFEHWVASKKSVNAACPGETSSSFINASAPDYGCNSFRGQLPPFKGSIGLHTNYTTSQLDFALSQLAANKHINLVSLQIGSNDVLLVSDACGNDPACIAPQLPGVLLTVGHNLAYILTKIRSVYKGDLVLVTYYSPSPELDAVAVGLKAVMTSVGAQFGAKIADGYTAFKVAAAFHGGDACAAGLLVKLSPTTCDIHPSPAGQALLAATVEIAYKLH